MPGMTVNVDLCMLLVGTVLGLLAMYAVLRYAIQHGVRSAMIEVNYRQAAEQGSDVD